MRAFSYLLIKKLKNRFIEILHKPSQLVIMLVFVGMLIVTIISGNQSQLPTGERSITEFYAIVTALFSVVFIMVSKNGFVNGASMFAMSDVNMIFPAPFKANRILTFGLVQQLGRSLLLGFFILFQVGWVNDCYGINFVQLLPVLVGYGVTVFLAQMLAMLIYSMTASDDRRCTTMKAIYYTVVIGFIVYILYFAYTNGGINLETIVGAINSSVFKLSFISYGVNGLIAGDYSALLIALVCTAIYCILYFLIISRLDSDYYEDVLKATEVSFSAITARKKGKTVENAPRNIKVGKTGFTHGEGASAIAQKHRIENRRGKVFIFDMVSLVMIAVTIVFAFIFKDTPVAIFALSVYVLTISIGNGRWAKELIYPYVYLIPESPAKKLFNMLKEQIPSLVAETVVCFIPVYFIAHCTITEVLGMILARISFGFLFIGINLILQRIFGNSDKKVLIILIYFVFIVIFAAPSIIVAVCVSTFMPEAFALSYIAMAVINTIVSGIILYLCRNILQYAEYNNK